MFIAVIAWTGDNRVSKFLNGFATLADAQAHCTAVGSGFGANDPGGGPRDWLVDAGAETLSLSPPDLSADIKEQARTVANNKATLIVAQLFVDLIEALLAKGVIAATDFPLETRQEYQELKGLIDDWRALP